MRRHSHKFVAVDLQRLHQAAPHRADSIARSGLENLPRLIPDEDKHRIDADQQRNQANDGVEDLIEIGQAVDRFGHLQQGGIDPRFFLLGGAQIGALQSLGRLLSHVLHQLFA